MSKATFQNILVSLEFHILFLIVIILDHLVTPLRFARLPLPFLQIVNP